MANELSIGTVELRFSKGSRRFKNPAFQNSLTVAGNHYIAHVQTIGTTDETLALGDVATPGVVFFLNTDDTNFVTLGEDGSSYPIKILPGEPAQFRWNGAAIHAIADTASIDLQ